MALALIRMLEGCSLIILGETLGDRNIELLLLALKSSVAPLLGLIVGDSADGL